MITEYTVTRGDLIITRNGEQANIDKVLYQEVYTDYADIEFFDYNHNYRHYKSVFDGGMVVMYTANTETVLQYN